jgi:hypothetical protein
MVAMPPPQNGENVRSTETGRNNRFGLLGIFGEQKNTKNTGAENGIPCVLSQLNVSEITTSDWHSPIGSQGMNQGGRIKLLKASH